MGDSGVSCAFTGVSMNYGRVALIALAPKYFVEPQRTPVTYSLGSLSDEPFAALFLPIFGSLDGYGGLRDIERDRNVEFLEKKLSMPIDDIAELLVRGGHLPAVDKLARRVARHEHGTFAKYQTWDGSLRSMVVMREAYDQFSAYTMDDSGRPDSTVWDSPWVRSDTFEYLGFELVPKDAAEESRKGSTHWSIDDLERYDRLYTHPKIQGLSVWSDEHMSAKYFAAGQYLGGHIFGIAQLQRALDKQGAGVSLLPEQIELAKRTPAALISLRETRRAWLKRIKSEKEEYASRVEYPEFRFDRVAFDDTTLTFCDDHWHYVADRLTGALKADVKRVRCPTGFSQQCAMQNNLKCSYETKPGDLFAEGLRAQGWKPPRRLTYPSSGGDGLAVVYPMAPEGLLLYGLNLTKLFANQMVGLHHFYSNSKLGNKIWQPSARGCQYGCNRMQSNIARFSQELLQKRLDDEYRRELEDILATSGDE